MALSRKDIECLPASIQAQIAAQLGETGSKPSHPSHTPGQMNTLEREYADYLDMQVRLGEVVRWWFECVKIRIAERCWLTPDFLIEFPNGKFELHDSKGFVREDAKIKAKVVADKYPFPVFFVEKCKGGGWTWTRIKGRIL